jgi:cobalt/nickel transport system permease protein
MHIPDNYLSPSTCAVMGAAMLPVWAVASRKVTGEVSRARVPLLGISAAFAFLVMMFNIPLPGGTTGHAVGGVLMAAVLGPWSACISVSIALLIQALMFGDGGILSFGANAFNMAFVLPFTGYFLFAFIRDRARTERGRMAGLAAGAYVGVVVAALFTAIELGIQPVLFRGPTGLPLYNPYPLVVSVPAMLLPHLLVAGVVEALFTVGIFTYIRRVSPDLLVKAPGAARTRPVHALLAVLVLLSPLGLIAAGTAWAEWTPAQISSVVVNGRALGYVPAGIQKGFSFPALFPRYAVNGLPEPFGYIIAGIAGASILLITFKLLGLLRRADRKRTRA